MAGNLDAKGCYNVWKNRQGSAHYAISSKGEIGQLIDEKYRAWSVANAAADSIAVTMELANDGGASYDLGATYEDNADIDLYAIWKLEAIEVRAMALDEWRDGIIYLKSHGTWVIPKKGYCKVLGEWKEIIEKEIEEDENEQQNV